MQTIFFLLFKKYWSRFAQTSIHFNTKWKGVKYLHHFFFVSSCTFFHNEGGQGGVLFFDDNTVGHYTNCLFENNIATNEGGGVAFTDDNSAVFFRS